MEKKDILKYLIIYIIGALALNYFFSKKASYANDIGTVVGIEHHTLHTSRPVSLDLAALKNPINKLIERPEAVAHQDQTIYIETAEGKFGFSSYTGAPISYHYFHPITKKFIPVFDYTDEEKNRISPLSLSLNNRMILNYQTQINENEKEKNISFKTTQNEITINRTYIIKESNIESHITVENPHKLPIHSIQLISEEGSLIDQDERKGFFIYNPEEKILKFSVANPIPFANSVIFKPEIIGLQSTFFSQSIIQKNSFDRAFFQIQVDEKSQKQGYYFIEKSVFDSLDFISLSFSWYCGPKLLKPLETADTRLPLILEQGFFSKISNFFFTIIFYFVSVFKNLGVSLILFALLIKMLVLPFVSHIRESNRLSKEFQQKLEYVKAKYHDDPKKKSEEEMLLIKKYGIFPGFLARVPQLINVFVMITLPSFLKSNILFYHVPVGFWMTDASLPDKYFILPIICFLFAYLQINNTKMTPMMKIGVLILVLICMYAFSFLASGMQLFIVTGLVLGYFENKLLLA